MSEGKALPQIARKKRISRGEAMLGEEKVEGIWVVRMYDTVENGAVLDSRECKRQRRNDGM